MYNIHTGRNPRIIGNECGTVQDSVSWGEEKVERKLEVWEGQPGGPWLTPSAHPETSDDSPWTALSVLRWFSHWPAPLGGGLCEPQFKEEEMVSQKGELPRPDHTLKSQLRVKNTFLQLVWSLPHQRSDVVRVKCSWEPSGTGPGWSGQEALAGPARWPWRPSELTGSLPCTCAQHPWDRSAQPGDGKLPWLWCTLGSVSGLPCEWGMGFG